MSEDEVILIEQFGKRKQAQEEFDGERNLSINCRELRHLRRYLIVVGQWYPEEWSGTKRTFYHIWQFLVTVGVWTHFLYSLGFFGTSNMVHSFKWFPINGIEEIIWELRWVIAHHIGLYYFCVCRHMERFLEESCLNQALWNETSRYLKKICLAVVVLVFVIPVLLRPLELSYSLADSSDSWWIVMDTVILGLDRLVTAPIFLVFVFEAYVLVRVMKGYGERIRSWPKDYKNVPGSGIRAAKLQFAKTNSLIGSVGSNFQLYLSLHFLFLLITAFLGVFACAEQIETKVHTNHSYFSAETPKYYKRMRIAPAIIKPPVKVKIVPIETSQTYLQSLLTLKAGLRGRRTKPVLVNVTLKEEITEDYDQASEKRVFIEVGIEATLKILESVVLYMIPLTLMLRLQTKLALVRQNILFSDCFEQQDNGYLFQDEKTIRTMAKFVGTCRGITIFGYKMPLFRAFLLAVFAPFLTALTTFLFSYIHVKRM